MRLETESDCALINTGTVRSDLLFKSGILTMGDIRLMFPYPDLVMQLELTGEQLIIALENGVSKYPALEGRFPAVILIRESVLLIVYFSFLESVLSLTRRRNQ